MLSQPHPYPGKLIIVEGIDGSGKSTQLSLLHRWLLSRGVKAFFTEWNSSLLVRRSMRRGKKKDLLTPTTFSLLHAVDFADRLTYKIIPPLKAGMVVLADRYVYTAFARDIGARRPSRLGARSLSLRAAARSGVLLPRPDRGLARSPAHRSCQAQVPRSRHGHGPEPRPGGELPPVPEPRARRLRSAGAASTTCTSSTRPATSTRSNCWCAAWRARSCATTTARSPTSPPRPPTWCDVHGQHKTFYGHGLPNLKVGPLRGSLIVVEGTDGVGRSTQIDQLIPGSSCRAMRSPTPAGRARRCCPRPSTKPRPGTR